MADFVTKSSGLVEVVELDFVAIICLKSKGRRYYHYCQAFTEGSSRNAFVD